ncbi:RNA binding motif protein 18 [Sporobolomyces salmoneus]|uniref:RNA binding motif protein 18 n=1 Tax=Sporobolomyces salmoneus TaxID=183962 RepID=UPI0031822327
MSSTPSALGLSEKRLYVGNLSASVDEYSLMQICAKYGKISKLDYLFHKSGPMKGKPRGYAFVEYATKEEAKRAMVTLHDKVLRGRKLVVSLASEQEPKESGTLVGGKKRKGSGAIQSDSSRPTAISLLKGQGVAHVPTNRKIAALEAKLAAIKQKKDPSSSNTPPAASTSSADHFLNDLLPSTTTTDDSSSTTTDQATTSSTVTSKIDSAKAGLPTRPYFESNDPPREM